MYSGYLSLILPKGDLKQCVWVRPGLVDDGGDDDDDGHRVHALQLFAACFPPFSLVFPCAALDEIAACMHAWDEWSGRFLLAGLSLVLSRRCVLIEW